MHPAINGKSHLCPSVIFLKKQLSRLSLSRVVFQLLLPRSSASSSIFFIHLLLLVRRRDSIFFTVLGISASWRFNPFIVLRISSHFCVGLWVWFFYKDFGFAQNDQIISGLVSTFPVILDTILKYWIFSYLNRVSPSLVVIYHSMND